MDHLKELNLFAELAALNVLLPYLAVCLIVGFAIIAIFQLTAGGAGIKSRSGIGPRSSNYLSLLILVLSFLGGTVGFTGGWSRVGVVGDVVPAALTLIGGLTVYLFENKKGRGIVAALSALTFTIALFAGFAVGAQVRNPSDRFTKYRDFCYDALKDPDIIGNNHSFCRFITGAGNQCWSVLFTDNAVFYYPGKTQKEIKEIWGLRYQKLKALEAATCVSQSPPSPPVNATNNPFSEWPELGAGVVPPLDNTPKTQTSPSGSSRN